MFNYSQYHNRILLELKTLGMIEEMTEFEKQEYEKNPSLKTGLISQSRLEKAMKFTIKEELGESVISNKNALSYKYLDSNKLDKKKLAKAKENDNNIK